MIHWKKHSCIQYKRIADIIKFGIFHGAHLPLVLLHPALIAPSHVIRKENAGTQLHLDAYNHPSTVPGDLKVYNTTEMFVTSSGKRMVLHN